MSSTPSILTKNDTPTSSGASTPVPDAFGRLMDPKRQGVKRSRRDTCARPPYTYNSNYNPYEPPNTTLHGGYSPYVFGEPLFDDRPLDISELPRGFVPADPPKKPRTQWFWKLGYAIFDKSPSSPNKKQVHWACKHCLHDPMFRRHKTWYYSGTTLNNAEKHLKDEHCLNEGGDIWRIRDAEDPALASSGFELSRTNALSPSAS